VLQYGLRRVYVTRRRHHDGSQSVSTPVQEEEGAIIRCSERRQWSWVLRYEQEDDGARCSGTQRRSTMESVRSIDLQEDRRWLQSQPVELQERRERCIAAASILNKKRIRYEEESGCYYRRVLRYEWLSAKKKKPNDSRLVQNDRYKEDLLRTAGVP
jgi:hypothetical protein